MATLKRYLNSAHIPLPIRDDWKRCIIATAEAGFDGIELLGAEFEDENRMDKNLLRVYAETARNSGVKLSAHPFVEWAKYPVSLAQAKWKKLLDYCATMEAGEIIMHFAFLTDREQGWKRLYQILDPEIGFLASHNITLLFENVPDHGIRELGSETADFCELFRHYGSDTPVMLNLDTGHAQIMGITRELTTQCGNRWLYTHIHDNNGINDSHSIPGTGVGNWDELALCAKNANYTGPLIMEYPNTEIPQALPLLIKSFNKKGFLLAPLKNTFPDFKQA